MAGTATGATKSFLPSLTLTLPAPPPRTIPLPARAPGKFHAVFIITVLSSDMAAMPIVHLSVVSGHWITPIFKITRLADNSSRVLTAVTQITNGWYLQNANFLNLKTKQTYFSSLNIQKVQNLRSIFAFFCKEIVSNLIDGSLNTRLNAFEGQSARVAEFWKMGINDLS